MCLFLHWGKKKEQIFVVLMDIVQLVPLTLPKFKFTQLFKLTNVTISMEQRLLHILPVAYFACSERILWKLVSAI